MIQIKQGTEDEARAIWLKCAPADTWDTSPDAIHWVAYDDGKPVGFGSMRPLTTDKGWMYFTAAAVLPDYRGAGLQRRLIRVRKQWVKRQGLKGVITYTTDTNYPSIMNLLREGFRFYDPNNKWVGDGCHYFYWEAEY